jgi:transposase
MTIPGMAQNFIAVDRDQAFLMPPSLQEWLPEGHLAWCLLDVVGEMDLSLFYARYRPDGWGRPAYDPSMMVALILYSYCRGERSSRGIERECWEDVAYRVICANLTPDHVTINRFRSEHQDALAELFGQVLRLCAKAGMVNVGTIALDGTRVRANASKAQTMDYEKLARTILEEAAEVDAAEDELYGDKRGDELPERLSTRWGRQEWLREAKRQLEQERAAEARPVPRARAPRLREAKRRMEEELSVEQRANEAYEAWRARGVKSDGRKLNTPSTPYRPPDRPAGQVNVTDPDSRIVQSRHGFIQGYTAQAVTTKDQIVITAEVICGGNERMSLERLVDSTEHQLERAGVSDSVEVALADAGFWNTDQIASLTARGMKTLVNPDSAGRKSPAPNRQRRQHYVEMREQLASEEGKQHYSQRMVMIEPVFAHIKYNRRVDRFHRRGLAACRAEWKLITATHNLLKLWRYGPAPAPG